MTKFTIPKSMTEVPAMSTWVIVTSPVHSVPIKVQYTGSKHQVMLLQHGFMLPDSETGYYDAVTIAHLMRAAIPMYEALEGAKQQFQEYANSHAAKGDVDKAKRNQDRADACEATLAKARGKR